MESVDTGLLDHLEALLHAASVSDAAKQRGLSPSAMSRVLTRLREQLGDPLLVRAGHRLVRTPRAERLREELPGHLDAIRRLLARPTARPRRGRPFRVRAADAVAGMLGPPLLRELETQLADVSLVFLGEGDESVEALRDGSVDLDLGVQGELGAEIVVRPLFDDHMVGLQPTAAELDHAELDAYCAAEHVVVSRRGCARGPVDERLAALGRSRRVPLVVGSYHDAARITATAGFLAMLPASLAKTMQTYLPVRAFSLPVPTPPIHFAAAWHPRFQDDPCHRALREALLHLVARVRPTIA
ncbi:MAG: LysR family transcriptional regulator [Myxococcales bacterium]|nr:LysR family transcriptional regulator [Myxococcales bacterium]MCB9749291.1 LysR family transcriptional regulator [Myxococcales bacterium]